MVPPGILDALPENMQRVRRLAIDATFRTGAALIPWNQSETMPLHVHLEVNCP
jgi:hypothetical protein